MKSRLVLVLALVLGACASIRTLQEGREVEAFTYQAAPDALRLTVGKLRRLLVLPAQVDGGWSGSREPEAISQDVTADAASYLVDWKGYEIVRAGADAQASAAELRRLIRAGKRAEARIPAIAQTIGLAAGVDGVVLISGSMGFPTTRLEARIFAATTDELVWASRLRTRWGEALRLVGNYGEGLFLPLERAMPEVMVERRKRAE